MRHLIVIVYLCALTYTHAQSPDSIKRLGDIEVKAFNQSQSLLSIPAAVANITTADLQRFSNTTLLPVINTQPGVRMEERSPGSYRLSIRGSTLRSPFGVRNVKVYYNGLPMTNHGGETYLNMLDFGSVSGMEIIKGPGSSLYGAGTGGVMLLTSAPKEGNLLTGELTGGSFGSLRYRMAAAQRFKRFRYAISYAGQQADGYRDHTKLSRHVWNAHATALVSKRTSLTATFMASDIEYDTPGGLNRVQWQEDPTQARANADALKTGVFNNSWLGGLTMETEWNARWTSSTVASWLNTDFKNPTFLNYEKRHEQTLSARHETSYKHQQGTLVFGAEYQKGQSTINVGNNNAGSFVDLGNRFKIPTTFITAFVQSDYALPADFLLTAGASLNRLTIDYSDNTQSLSRTLGVIVSPRLALSKKLGELMTAYVSFNRGYSPPSRNEIFPSTAIYDPDLKPEFGNSYEAGLKGSWPWLEGSLTLYSFDLRNTIVRLDSAGEDYFTNAGRSLQNGLELYVRTISSKAVNAWVSYTFNYYRFKEYERNGQDFSGNPVTGVPAHVASGGLDVRVKNWYSNLTAQYVGALSLKDDNTETADRYTTLSLRTGIKAKMGKTKCELFGGADNLFDTVFSLGHDINANAGRFFNPAPGRSFYAGLVVGLVGR
jgi:iron complex outermembrane recepter protein